MRFITIDIECNQPGGEIIQLGAIAYDTQIKKVLGTFNCYVNPGDDCPINWNHTLNNSQTLIELLGNDFYSDWHINKEPSSIVMKKFWDFVSKVECGRKLVQWGGGDLAAIKFESNLVGIPTPSNVTILDAKAAYKLLYMPGSKDKYSGLASVCETLLPMGFVGRPHDALDDAMNTASVMIKLYEMMQAFQQIKGVIDDVK